MILTKEQKEKTTFTDTLTSRGNLKEVDSDSILKPSEWRVVELITRDYTLSGKSIFLAYQNDRNELLATLFIGTLND